MRLIYRLVSVVFIVLSCSSCTIHKTGIEARLDIVDSLLRNDPANALKAVKDMDRESLRGKRQKARYALSYSIALDKNHIDICSDSIIAPALEYYSRRGNDRERSFTYYYTGRIHENRNELEKAMEWMTMAEKHVKNRTYLHALINSCKGRLYQHSCDFHAAAGNFRTAAEIFSETGHQDRCISNRLREATCLLMAGEHGRAERIADDIMFLDTVFRYDAGIYPALLNIYDITRPQCTLALLERYLDQTGSRNGVDWLTAAQIYLSNGMAEEAMQALSKCKDDDAVYSYRMAQAHELSGDYRNALKSYKEYIYRSGMIGNRIVGQDTRFIEERIRQSDICEKVRMKNMILWLSIAVASMTLILAAFMIASIRKQMTIKEHEGEMLKFQLEGLMTEREELSRIHMADKEVRKIIAERLAIIDGFVMSETLQDNIFEKKAKEALKSIIEDRKKFILQTRLIFNQSHPDFIKYLKKMELSEREIEHCCLYAIGLNGKMATAFTNLKRHYHIGSDIRRKLGLNGHDTNLSIYIRKLLDDMGK